MTSPTPPDPGQSESGQFDSGQFESGQFDSGQFDSSQFESGQFESGQFDSSQSKSGQFGSGKLEPGQSQSARPASAAVRAASPEENRPFAPPNPPAPSATRQFERARENLRRALTRYAAWQGTPDSQRGRAELRAAVQPSLDRLSETLDKLDRRSVRIAAFGLVSRGKSAVLNALMGEAVLDTGPLHGVTRVPRSVRWRPDWLTWGGEAADVAADAAADAAAATVEVELIDTPGLDEIGGAARAAMAREVADRADLILFIAAGELTRVEAIALRELRQAHKPLILVFNKIDLYNAAERQAIGDRLRAAMRAEPVEDGDSRVATAPAGASASEGPSRNSPDGNFPRIWREASPQENRAEENSLSKNLSKAENGEAPSLKNSFSEEFSEEYFLSDSDPEKNSFKNPVSKALNSQKSSFEKSVLKEFSSGESDREESSSKESVSQESSSAESAASEQSEKNASEGDRAATPTVRAASPRENRTASSEENRELLPEFDWLDGGLPVDDIVLVAADPAPVQVREEWPDGRITYAWEASPPDIDALRSAIRQVLDREGRALLALNALLQARTAEQTIARESIRLLGDEAEALSWQFVRGKALGVALSPLAPLDLLGGAIADLWAARSLARLYGLPLTVRAIGPLGRALAVSAGLLLAGEAGGWLWGSDGAALTVGAGGFGRYAGSALVQAGLAALGMARVGRAARRSLEADCTWGEDAIAREILSDLDPDGALYRLRRELRVRLASSAENRLASSEESRPSDSPADPAP